MRLSDIDLRLLRVFKAVAEAGGFVRAQGELGISQPAISAHIANLEKRLDVRLCNRGRQGFSLTPQGREVLDETDRILSHLDSYANRLGEIANRTAQNIRIGVVDCLVTDPENPLPAAIKAVAPGFADLRVGVGVYDYLDCLTELRAGRIDISIIGINEIDQMPGDVESLHIYDEASGLFCIPDHPCAAAPDPQALDELLKSTDISAHSFLMNPMEDGLEIHLLEEDAEISQSTIETTVYLTLAGTHVGLIPLHYADHWLRRGEMVALAPECYRVISRFHALRLAAATRSAVAEALWRELAAGL